MADLTRDDLGKLVEVEGWTSGYLYVLLDEFHDGYPSRTLTLVLPGDYGDTAERSFTDSDPAGYPQTMGTPVAVEKGSEGCPCGSGVAETDCHPGTKWADVMGTSHVETCGATYGSECDRCPTDKGSS